VVLRHATLDFLPVYGGVCHCCHTEHLGGAMSLRYNHLLQSCIVPEDQAAELAQSQGMAIPEGKLDVTKFTRLIVQECVWLFGETRTEPSLERFILTRLGIDHE
jgi:hypothetical protein